MQRVSFQDVAPIASLRMSAEGAMTEAIVTATGAAPQKGAPTQTQQQQQKKKLVPWCACELRDAYGRPTTIIFEPTPVRVLPGVSMENAAKGIFVTDDVLAAQAAAAAAKPDPLEVLRKRVKELEEENARLKAKCCSCCC
jgi:hypothetical protein